jgi:hypothetical protein
MTRAVLDLLILALACGCMSGCGLSLGLPLPMPAQGGQPSFRCGGSGMSIKFTSGTGDFPGSVTVTNLQNDNSKTRLLDPRTPAGAAATNMELDCSDVNVRCGLQGIDTLKVCGKSNTVQVQAVEIGITSTDFPND